MEYNLFPKKKVMFNNQPNNLIKGTDGQDYWISRSSVVICLVSWKSKVLIVKRGKSVIQTGKWCLPCGYLDFNETIEECAVREIWEESGIDIRKYIKVDGLKPSYINSDPFATKNQDICFHFTIEIDSDIEPEIDISVVDLDETIDVKWVDVSDVVNYDFAFNHDKRIEKWILRI